MARTAATKKNPRRRAWLLCLAVVLVAMVVGFFVWKRPDNALRIATASVADVMCSGVFVSGMEPERAFNESFADDKGLAFLLPHIHYAVDRSAGASRSTGTGTSPALPRITRDTVVRCLANAECRHAERSARRAAHGRNVANSYPDCSTFA